jgi:general secretion pathway protein D
VIPPSAPPASGGTRAPGRAAALVRAYPGSSRTRAGSPRSLATLGLIAALGSADLAIAQPDQGPQLTANYRESDIRVVADQVQQVIGRPIIIDPRVRAQVTVLSNAPMSPAAFYQLFLATLEVHGFVALDSGDAIQIVPDANARFGEGDDYVTQAIVLDNIGAAQLVPILRPLLPQSAHLAAHPSSNALIVADRPNNIARMMTLIRRMDQAGTQDVEVIALENASADEVVRMLSALNQAAQAQGGAPPVQVMADARTNSVLLSGSGAVRLQYRGLIAHLDTPSAQGGETLVQYLNYADAEELATKLEAQFGGAGGQAPAPAEGGSPANTGPIKIWADVPTNALIISGPERVRQDVLALVKQIDIPRYQVMVDAIIVELTEEKAAQLGTTWILDGSDSNDGIGLTNFSGATGGILGLATAASGATPNPSAIGDGILLGVGRVRDGGTSWAAIVNALRGDADTNIVATPHLVTLDNEEAEIKVGQEVPFLTGQFTSTGAGGGNNGNVNPFQTIQREQVGTSLKITPQINEGSGVKLTIEQEFSSLSGSAAGAVDLVTNNRTITTSVFVNDGEVLVLGGLMDDQLRQNEQRVPGLGRIPGLGWLFRARKTDHMKKNLMVFIRPTILRNREDARFQTGQKYRYVQELQRQMAEDRVRLMRNEEQPSMPPLPPNVEETPAPTPDGAAPVDPTPEDNVQPDGGQPR